jgi:hypothetical protein
MQTYHQQKVGGFQQGLISQSVVAGGMKRKIFQFRFS